jgi:hypothetical protein
VTLQVFIDGRRDEMRNKTSNALLAKLQREDTHAQILNQYLAQYEGDGTYGFQGTVGDPSKGMTVPKAMLGEISHKDRIGRVRERIAKKEAPKSLCFVPGYEVELLSLEDQEAYEEGWICPACLQYQGMPANQCNWNFKGDRPSDPKDWGCGHQRNIF